MADRFSPGDRVRASRADPAHHTRLPRYARGAAGTIVEPQGQHLLPDDRARGIASERQTVYTVRFTARELFGDGEHDVTVDLWENYLEAAS